MLAGLTTPLVALVIGYELYFQVGRIRNRCKRLFCAWSSGRRWL